MRVLADLGRATVIVVMVLGAQMGMVGSGSAQQLHKGVTGSQCAAMGGRIITWTNTAGSGQSVGECYVPAAAPSGRATPQPSNSVGAAAGVAAGVLDLLKGFEALQEPRSSEPSEAQEAPVAPSPRVSRAEEIGRGVYRLAAEQSRGRNFCQAADNFRLAARYFNKAGDTPGAENANLQAGLVEADCKDQQASSSQATQRAGSCVPYFQKMRKMFRENAAVCLKETRLLQSLIDMAGSNQTASGDPRFTRASAPELFAILEPNDPGWKQTATHASPKCAVPLRVGAQSEAFSECARVYLCGAAAASCGLRRARETNTNDCLPISHACLAEHPVPKLGHDRPPPSDGWEPRITLAPPGSRGPVRGSTITGPSGPGSSGGPSGGVTTAR